MTDLAPRLSSYERNIAINGNIDFAQRVGAGGSAAVGAAVVRYTIDRFNNEYGGLGFTGTVDQAADVPTFAQSGFQSTYSLRYTQGASTNTRGFLFQYPVEGYDYEQLHGGKKFRVQFWVKASIAGLYGVVFSNNSENRYYATSYTVTSPGVWQKAIFDLPSDNAGTWSFDNNIGLRVWIGVNNGSGEFTPVSTTTSWQTGTARLVAGTVSTVMSTVGATFQIAQFAIIPQDFTLAGSSNVDVPFQRAGRSIAHELQLCKRYYEQSMPAYAPPNGSGNGPIGIYYISVNSPSPKYTIQYSVEKRGQPTLQQYSYATNTAGVYRDVTGGVDRTGSTGSANGLTSFAFDFSGLPSGNNAALSWSADAEL